MKTVKNKRIQETVELNITAFLNLMVILVPFLLITAVFSRMSILELNLPDKNAKPAPPQQESLQLQVVVRPDSLELRDANLGRFKFLPRSETGTDWRQFTDMLVAIKMRYPEQQDVTLLLDPDISYKTLIQVMDHVRTADVLQMAQLETVELFPNISIADAPVEAPVEAVQENNGEEPVE